MLARSLAWARICPAADSSACARASRPAGRITQMHTHIGGSQFLGTDARVSVCRPRFRKVICGPAARAQAAGTKLQWAPEVVDRLLQECDASTDALSLLSLAGLYEDYGKRAAQEWAAAEHRYWVVIGRSSEELLVPRC